MSAIDRPETRSEAPPKPADTARDQTISQLSGVFAGGYSPAPERTAPQIDPRQPLWIAGARESPENGEWFATINPATETPLAEIANAGQQDVDRAVRAARNALDAWRSMPGIERGKRLFRVARRIQEHARELAVLESMDGGKPIRESRDVDLPLVAQHFFYYAGWADKLDHAFSGAGSPEPVGVCGQIVPWNFPLLMAAWKLAPALACGNTCVLKPAETTPLTALRLGEIMHESGVPDGVVNILTGDGATGAALAEHPDVDKLAFTGSTEVGKRLAAIAAGRDVRLTLELGGKSPHLIFDDASLDQAVEGVVQGIFFNQGHVCCAGSRLLVHEPVLEAVLDRLRVRLMSLRVGDPLDKNTDLGAINSREQLDRIISALDRGVRDGASLWVGGQGAGADASPTETGFDAGFWCRPCVLSNVRPGDAVAREEIFGPVVSVMTFRTTAEAVELANDSAYGLAAGVWTDKGSRVFELARSLKAGVVWLNTYNRFDAASPFGGFKESGFGREGGRHGLAPYLKHAVT